MSPRNVAATIDHAYGSFPAKMGHTAVLNSVNIEICWGLCNRIGQRSTVSGCINIIKTAVNDSVFLENVMKTLEMETFFAFLFLFQNKLLYLH